MDVEQLLTRALELADEGDWPAAAELIREHLGDFEDEPAVHCWLGVAERELGMDGIAYERFKRALALDPEDPHVLATAGNGVAAFDDPEAEQALRTAALTAPDLAVTRLLYGAYLAREGLPTDALEHLEAARRIDPEDGQIAYELGVGRYLAGDLAGAVDAVGESVQLDAGDTWGRVTLGLMLLEADRAEEAAAELIRGARDAPEDVEAQLAAALAAAAVGAEAEAFELVERARLRGGPGDEPVIDGVEDAVEAGTEASAKLLHDELAVEMLRLRTRERP